MQYLKSVLIRQVTQQEQERDIGLTERATTGLLFSDAQISL
jgi:hypothetical protein